MARDYVEILKRLEAHYPQALGISTSQDASLKSVLTGFANDLIAEIDRETRWSLSFAEPSFVTTPNQAVYTLPYPAGTGTTTLLASTSIDRVWWIDTPTGGLRRLDRLAKEELQRVFGDNANSQPGEPRFYTIENSLSDAAYNASNPLFQIKLYPTPDGNGPDSGNYTLRMSGYFTTPPIIEVLGSTTASSTTLTVATGTSAYLTALGEPTSSAGMNLTLSVRNAGSPGPLGTADTHVTGWTAIPGNVTMSIAAAATANNVQCFFNSSNWLIRDWPKVLIFGMAREIASYYGSIEKYAVWEQRFQDQMDKLRAYEFDRNRGYDSRVVAYTGGNDSALKRTDEPNIYDVRGGTW